MYSNGISGNGRILNLNLLLKSKIMLLVTELCRKTLI
jgi:hypothetical protein